jgi:hypothetical protein
VKPNSLARFAAVILALAGVAALLAAAVVSLRGLETRVPPFGKFDCGSVLFAKDPRNLAPPRGEVPLYLKTANKKCENLRSDQTTKAITFMVAGAIPLLLVLALPFLSRRARRSSRRRRVRM